MCHCSISHVDHKSALVTTTITSNPQPIHRPSHYQQILPPFSPTRRTSFNPKNPSHLTLTQGVRLSICAAQTHHFPLVRSDQSDSGRSNAGNVDRLSHDVLRPIDDPLQMRYVACRKSAVCRGTGDACESGGCVRELR